MLTFPSGALNGQLVAIDYEEGTVTGVAGGLTASKFGPLVSHVLIRHENGPSNMRIDGNAPLAGIGWPLFHGDQIWLSLTAATKLQMIRSGVTNGNFRAIYFQKV